MPNTAINATRDKLREAIERLVSLPDPSIPQAFTTGMQAFLTARDYNDLALMKSALNTALEAMQQVICEAVEKRLGWPQRAREDCRKIRELMKGCVCENWDEPGRTLESALNMSLKTLTDLRDGPVKLLQEHGYEVENAAQLDRAIDEMKELKISVLGDWPWSDRELPPVDWDMVDASRAARERGEGEPIENLIRRLGGKPTKRG